MTFYEWLVRLNGLDTPTGDLARDVLRDNEFPENKDNETVYNYLSWRATADSVERAVKSAWSSYRAYCRRHPDSE